MRRTTATIGAVALLVTGIGIGARLPGADGGPDDGSGDGSTALLDDVELAGALSGFEVCDDYLAHVREHALEQVGPHGLRGGPGHPVAGREAAIDVDGAAVAEDSAAGGTPSARTTPEGVSGTNVQEEGVDEPDQVKTDGQVAYTTTDGTLRVLDVTGDDPEQLASLELAGGHGAELLLHGDRLLITSAGGPVVPLDGAGPIRGRADVAPVPGGGTTTLTAVDVSDPADPVVEERLTLDGATLSARMVEGVARVAIRTAPGASIPWEHPEASGLRAERAALQANQQLIRDSSAEDWLPYFVHETSDDRETEGVALDCEQVARPSEFAGLGMLSVLTVDVGGGALVPDDGAVGVLAGGDTVYASTDRLYVATQQWVDPRVLEEAAAGGDEPDVVDDIGTEVHAFDISEPGTTAYLASGEVPGVLLDQWALSEHDGVLRVASTIGDRWWGGGEDSSSLVTTLERDGDELVEIGQVGDLGPTERIYAVRFIEDVGYVVTFRRTDPLYVLDLSDPAEPEVTGELKIAGYSAYLHPVGDGLLLGVGQDAEEDTGQTLGTQVSLFDVADPTDPRRLDTLTVEGARSDVEHDHRAFLHWPETGLTVVPLTRGWHGVDEAPSGRPNGALAFTADRDGFAPAVGDDPEQLALSHADAVELPDDVPAPESDLSPEEADRLHAAMASWRKQGDAAIRRSVVAGDRLLTFSARGVVVHDLDTLAPRGELEH